MCLVALGPDALVPLPVRDLEDFCRELPWLHVVILDRQHLLQQQGSLLERVVFQPLGRT